MGRKPEDAISVSGSSELGSWSWVACARTAFILRSKTAVTSTTKLGVTTSREG